jgi:hypothetical protein
MIKEKLKAKMLVGSNFTISGPFSLLASGTGQMEV